MDLGEPHRSVLSHSRRRYAPNAEILLLPVTRLISTMKISTLKRLRCVGVCALLMLVWNSSKACPNRDNAGF